MARLAWDRGRVDQKLRTRQALMDAAVELLQAGSQPSVDAVAARAHVSRATAYRYFPGQDLLLSEAMVRAGAGPDPDGAPPDGAASDDLARRAAAVTRRAAQFSLEHEERLRTALRLSLDPQSGYRRPGRRGQWVEHILAPAGRRLDGPTRARLTHALNLVLGIDPIVVLTDVAGLDRDEAVEVLAWAASALVDGALADGALRSSR